MSKLDHTQHYPFICYVQADIPALGVSPELTALLVCGVDGILLWENQGSFRLIPTAILQNIHSTYQDMLAQAALNPRAMFAEPTIQWDQGTPISAEAVRVLLRACNSSDDSVETDTTTDTPGEDQPD